MKTWIALLRGINMVGHHRVAMKELVALLEGLGAREVKTYHQSGNAVFRHRGTNAARLAGRIERSLGVPATGRAWSSVVKVMAMAEAMG